MIKPSLWFKKSKKRYLLLRICTICIPLHKGRRYVPSLVLNWPLGFGDEKVLNVCNVFLLCHYHFPLNKSVAFNLTKPDFTSSRDVMCQIKFRSVLYFWRKNILKSCQYIFTMLVLSPLRQRRGPSFE